MDNISIDKIEKSLNLYPKEVGIAIGMKSRSGIYRVRKNYPKKYKLLLLGIRIEQSPLKLKELLNILEATEKIKGI